MTIADEIGLTDATGLAQLVRQKEVKPVELVDAVVERIERLNPALNAVVIEMYEHARGLAEGPIGEGPFAGVPFLLKDFLAEYAGVPFTQSSTFLEGFVPDEDTELVRRYKKAGLITVAKTNTPEFAIGATTEPALRGPSRNPWDASRTTGGSSGGAAAAVAAGIVPVAHGNDAGGSIRIPASCCGAFGLKPTRARNPLGPHLGDIMSGLVAEHVLTRTVRDSAAVLDATSGPAAGDPYRAPPPARRFLEEVGVDPGRLRIAMSTVSPLGVEADPECVAAVEDAARLCEELGHEVVETAPSFDGERAWTSFTTLIASGTAASLDGWADRLGKQLTADAFEPFIWAMTERARAITAPEYLLAVQDMHAVSRSIAPFFETHDLWLTPTLGQPPVSLGTLAYTGGDPFEHRRRLGAFASFTYVSNLTGQPSMSVPLHWSAAGLPIGVHFAARFGDEATLFRLASQLEEARPWAGRVPPISA